MPIFRFLISFCGTTGIGLNVLVLKKHQLFEMLCFSSSLFKPIHV